MLPVCAVSGSDVSTSDGTDVRALSLNSASYDTPTTLRYSRSSPSGEGDEDLNPENYTLTWRLSGAQTLPPCKAKRTEKRSTVCTTAPRQNENTMSECTEEEVEEYLSDEECHASGDDDTDFDNRYKGFNAATNNEYIFRQCANTVKLVVDKDAMRSVRSEGGTRDNGKRVLNTHSTINVDFDLLPEGTKFKKAPYVNRELLHTFTAKLAIRNIPLMGAFFSSKELTSMSLSNAPNDPNNCIQVFVARTDNNEMKLQVLFYTPDAEPEKLIPLRVSAAIQMGVFTELNQSRFSNF